MPKKAPDPMVNGLPVNIEAERYTLGAIQVNGDLFPQANALLTPEDFSLEAHRLIFQRMADLYERGGKIDRIAVANELMRHRELDACGGIGYLVDLDTGMPLVANADSYARIVKDKSILRRAIFLSQQVINRAMTQGESPSEVLNRATGDFIQLDMESGGMTSSLSPLQIMQSHPGGVSGFHQQAVKPGISTGFPQIDDSILGFQEQCQYVIGGSTGSGKSSLAMGMGVRIAKRGIPVGVSALEMSKEQLLARMICAEAEVPIKAFLRGELRADQRLRVADASSQLAEIPLYIDDHPSLSPAEIPARVTRMQIEHKIRLWILDYLQLIDWQSGRGGMKFESEYAGITYTSRTCSLLARRLNLSTLLVSQLSRAGARKSVDPRPRLSDLRSSGQIENDAVGVILIFREEMLHHDRPELRERAEAIIAKARMGETGTKILRFQGRYTKFIDEDTRPETE